jgi:hypothetical protein
MIGAVTGGAWFGFGYDQEVYLAYTVVTSNSASCCYARGAGARLLSNATLTCADTDSGQFTLDVNSSLVYSTTAASRLVK